MKKLTDKRITFIITQETDKMLTYIRSTKNDNRSIQKEIEWLIKKRVAELDAGAIETLKRGNV